MQLRGIFHSRALLHDTIRDILKDRLELHVSSHQHRLIGEVGEEDPEFEFALLSSRIASKEATDAERARWRELRAKLAPPPSPPPLKAGAKVREHARAIKKLRFSYTA